jgi:hypothetical protein
MIPKNMKYAIHTRKDLHHVFICLRRLLALYDDTAIYYDVLFRRIQYAGLIDGENIQLCVDNTHVDLSLNEHGLSACRDILGGYMPGEDIDDYVGFIRSQNAIIDNQNTQLGILRNCTIPQLKVMINEADSYFQGANIELLKEMLQEELKTRSLFGRMRTAALNLVYRVKLVPRLLESAYVLQR